MGKFDTCSVSEVVFGLLHCVLFAPRAVETHTKKPQVDHSGAGIGTIAPGCLLPSKPTEKLSRDAAALGSKPGDATRFAAFSARQIQA